LNHAVDAGDRDAEICRDGPRGVGGNPVEFLLNFAQELKELRRVASTALDHSGDDVVLARHDDSVLLYSIVRFFPSGPFDGN
jgi:hypothetical protein